MDSVETDSAGTKSWWRDGERHRDGDLPAVEWSNGSKEWFFNGKHHRDGDKPAIERTDGFKKWYRDGVEYTPRPVLPQVPPPGCAGRWGLLDLG